MKLKSLRYLLAGSLVLLALNCANKGNPSGGEIDLEPPLITRTDPENYSTNFDENEIYIYFNEYVKIKDLQKQLIISPPMDPLPEITPLGSAKKFIKIVITDTLSPNTTYAINFGNSIVDNNEGNPYSYYKYVFSTGEYIDSLSVSGRVFSAGKREVDKFISVMLYELDSTYTDSIVYKERPRYITNTLDSTTVFNLENLKPGTYRMLALKDDNNDYKFQQKTDEIGFFDGVVTIPSDSSYNITLFKEKFDDKILRSNQAAGQKISFGFEGSYNAISISMLGSTPDNFKSRITKDKATDTLYYWYKPKLELDTTYFAVSNKKYVDTLLHRFKDLERDSLVFRTTNSGTVDFGKDFSIEANIPLVNFDLEKVKIIDKDSIDVEFTTAYDSLSNAYTLEFEKNESQLYKIEILPEALEDFFGNKNDSLQYNLRTNLYTDYSNVRVNLTNARYPMIVQLANDKDEVKYKVYAEQPGPIDFRNISAGTYHLRVVEDQNKNGEWDSGNYLKRQQPEAIYYHDKPIEARANFDFVYDFDLPQRRLDQLKN